MATMTEQRGRGAARPALWPSLAGGLAFALAGLLVAPLIGVEIGRQLDTGEGRVNWITLLAGVFLVGWLLWWLLIARPGRFSLRRGASTGVLVALVSYPAVLLLAEFFQREWSADLGAVGERVGHALMLSCLGLATTGFATSIAFAIVGAAASSVIGRFAGPAAEARRGLAARLLRALVIVAASVVVLLLGTFVWLSLVPMKPLAADFAFDGAATHEEAMEAFTTVEAREAELALHPRCGSTLLTHGEKVQRAIVYFHGLTNCPAQADELAPMLFAAGYNVYVPRLPGHGEADPLTLSLADLTAEDLVAAAQESVALAQGLGEEVVVIGLSAGGTVTAMLAQYGEEVDDSISVSPFFGPYDVPLWAVPAATNLLLMLPNMMMWWDPEDIEGSPEMDYAYPRFATHGLAQVMRLGRIVDASAHAAPPLAQRLAMLLNDADLAVSNIPAKQIVAAWRDHGREVAVEVLPYDLDLPHDLIDPRHPGSDVGIVYPLLEEMIGRAGP